MNKFFGWLSLFTSFGTLICCAIPSMLVLLGLGSVLAGFLGEYPQLIWLSENKIWVFAVSLTMLLGAQILQRLSFKQDCESGYCEVTSSWAKPVWWVALTINLFGIFWAYVLPQLV